VTVKDIATAVGVSVATVSNVLNDRPNLGADSRRKVLEALTFRDAILRHRGDATDVTKRFDKLSLRSGFERRMPEIPVGPQSESPSSLATPGAFCC
jgi:transcriptional regulator with XRE-family HTH domain